MQEGLKGAAARMAWARMTRRLVKVSEVNAALRLTFQLRTRNCTKVRDAPLPGWRPPFDQDCTLYEGAPPPSAVRLYHTPCKPCRDAQRELTPNPFLPPAPTRTKKYNGRIHVWAATPVVEILAAWYDSIK